MEIVVIAGNGTSLVYTPRLAGPDLAAQIADELPVGLADQLRAVAVELGTDLAPGKPDDDFEHVVGPLDRIASALQPLASGTHVPAGEAGAVSAAVGLVRALHRQALGVALDVIARHSVAAMGNPALLEYRKFVTWALGLVPPAEAGIIRFFNLCYDGLLSSQLFDQAEDADFKVSDQALGYNDLALELHPGEPKIGAWPMRPATEPEYIKGRRAVVLYHLHGSLGWLRVPLTGQVFKATLADLRDKFGFYRAYADGTTTMQPVVILTDRKTAEVSREPFFTAYTQLATSLATADAVVIAGYAFRDVPLNTALAVALGSRADRLPRVLVLGHAADETAKAAYRTTALTALAPDSNVRSALVAYGGFECWTGGLPADLGYLGGWPST